MPCIGDHHKDQGSGNTASCAHGASHSTADCAFRLIRVYRCCVDQKGCSPDTDRGVGDLLQNLRDRSLHHGLVGLEISAYRTQNTEQKDCRRKDSEDRDCVVLDQDPRAEIQEQAARSSHDQGIDQRTMKCPLSIFVLAHGNLGRHLS